MLVKISSDMWIESLFVKKVFVNTLHKCVQIDMKYPDGSQDQEKLMFSGLTSTGIRSKAGKIAELVNKAKSEHLIISDRGEEKDESQA